MHITLPWVTRNTLRSHAVKSSEQVSREVEIDSLLILDNIQFKIHSGLNDRAVGLHKEALK